MIGIALVFAVGAVSGLATGIVLGVWLGGRDDALSAADNFEQSADCAEAITAMRKRRDDADAQSNEDHPLRSGKWFYWIFNPPPDPFALVETCREGDLDTKTLVPADMPPEWNIYGVYWRPIDPRKSAADAQARLSTGHPIFGGNTLVGAHHAAWWRDKEGELR